MELKLLNANGQEGTGVSASDVVFGRDYNEALIHQIVVAYQANARSGNRAQKDREQVKHTTKKPWRQKGTGPCPCRYVVEPAVARRWSHLPELARRKLRAQGQQEDASRRPLLDLLAARP